MALISTSLATIETGLDRKYVKLPIPEVEELIPLIAMPAENMWLAANADQTTIDTPWRDGLSTKIVKIFKGPSLLDALKRHNSHPNPVSTEWVAMEGHQARSDR